MAPFTAPLWRWPSPAGIIMLTVPPDHAPPAMAPFGRCPVLATLDGKTWPTSIWHSRKHGIILLVPRKIRGRKAEGDTVEVALDVDVTRT